MKEEKTYPKADIAVDIIIVTENVYEKKSEIPLLIPHILLIQRKQDPFKDKWAIPGGYLNVSDKWGEGETTEAAAYRELEEETSLPKKILGNASGVKSIPLRHYIKQLGVYSDPKRDPRGRVISVVYYAFVPYSQKLMESVKARDDAKKAKWFPLLKLPKLAFDHNTILRDFINREKLN